MDKKADKTQQENQALNRALLWLGGAIVLEALVLLVNRYYVNFRNDELDIAVLLKNAFPVLAAVFGVLTVLGVFWTLRQVKGGRGASLPAGLTIGAAVLTVCCTVLTVFGMNGVPVLMVAVPAAGVLALIYYLYQKDFFLAALMGADGLFVLWWMRRGSWDLKFYVMVAAAFLCLAAAAAFAVWLKRQQGVLTLGGRRIRVFAKGTNYSVLFVTAAIVAVLIAAALILGATAAYYAMFVLVALLFVLAVYYTVKLM